VATNGILAGWTNKFLPPITTAETRRRSAAQYLAKRAISAVVLEILVVLFMSASG
jgi:hypothetical protein